MGKVRTVRAGETISSPEPGARVLLPVAHPPVPRPVATGRSGRVRSDGTCVESLHQHGTTGEHIRAL